MKHNYFITGIGTEVGKTIVSAIVTEAIEADYWKPIQAGDLDNSDRHKVQKLVSNKNTVFHKNSFALNMPMSPHAAAEIDEVKITSKKVKRPKTKNNLVIEGAGGLLVPISDKETIADLMLKEDRIILVSRHYLGSINHTLLTVEALKSRGLNCFGIIFSGEENKSTESIIEKMSGLPILGRIEQEPYFDQNVVKEYAEIFREKLK
ncbi:ATP-dependent dethiobiotin synthetase BioD [Salegentibacter salinarum]|uniref:ATP-dependent dethiobiotin synthetase BioD n=1 Tax=Salegentibacter salinarum TaxID=447422 RepID=A0A2N0U4D5_9FLAO|nr:dethiobiotin synthase [Salegentibacter salinarum]PKD21872.1 ATP-dependent dethiobiotin synthetase BioD [Salegentibacter salinarum]SKB32550.1 dethiobiotin synthetase [Salegentibacter salinarum]